MSKLVVANWKSNKNQAEVKLWLKQFLTADLLLTLKKLNLSVALTPAFVFVDLISQAVSDKENVFLATQDISPYPAGSYTGAVSAFNLSTWPVKYVIVGHSERRRWFRETSSDVALKVEQALANKLTPIVCVDENNFKEQAGKLSESVWKQCVIAYEPKNAIGSGLAADVSEVEKMVKKIKRQFSDTTKVLYGGSVTELNINDFLNVVDGVLVGHESLDADSFLNLIRSVKKPPKLI